MTVTLEREMDEEDVLGTVYAPHYPKKKVEGWWLVVGDSKRNSLLAIKRVALQHQAKVGSNHHPFASAVPHTLSLFCTLQVRLDFVAPDEAGDYDLTLYFMCDSYIGCDQEYEFNLKVAQGDDSDDDENGNDMEE